MWAAVDRRRRRARAAGTLTCNRHDIPILDETLRVILNMTDKVILYWKDKQDRYSNSNIKLKITKG